MTSPTTRNCPEALIEESHRLREELGQTARRLRVFTDQLQRRVGELKEERVDDNQQPQS